MTGQGHEKSDEVSRQVKALSAYGIPQDKIASFLGMDPKTLRKHYRAELDAGAVEVCAKVADSLVKKALGDGPQSVAAAIFFLKTRAGWRETMTIEAADGLPSLTVSIVKPSTSDADS